MRKLLLSFVLSASLTSVFAQKLDDVQEKISKGKYDEAKEKIDKLLADPKNQSNASAWYYKGKVYAELARQDSAGTLSYNAGKEAFEAFKKYQEMEPKNTLMILDQNVGLFQLYDMYYNRGVKEYNAKNYGAAFDKMKDALAVEGYVAKKGYSYNGFSFPMMDTTLINLAASSAYLAKREDESIPYFQQLADARLKDKEYKEIYGLLAEYYGKKNDAQNQSKYLALGRELYPTEGDYWTSLEFGNPGTDTLKRLERYDQMTQKYPNDFNLNMDYAIELFNYTYFNDKKPADYNARIDRVQKALDKALAINPNSAVANFVMSQHIYNQIYDFDDEIRKVRGTTAADVAKKKDLNAREDKKYEELYTYSQKAYDLYSNDTNMKAQDKANFRKVIGQLVDYYQRKKQADKVTFYQNKLKSL
ncbi:MAG TPA: hypothetical protein VHK91_00500 [Flavisolibacter sp.]|jgi:hypothetical protein|nr:hypothetical protein [Flavisolibacter sp.]